MWRVKMRGCSRRFRRGGVIARGECQPRGFTLAKLDNWQQQKSTEWQKLHGPCAIQGEAKRKGKAALCWDSVSATNRKTTCRIDSCWLGKIRTHTPKKEEACNPRSMDGALMLLPVHVQRTRTE
jgi:hypothetical protein